MTCNEFKQVVKGVSKNRTHKVTGSLGVYDAYKWIRKNKWLDIGRPLTEQEFYSIIRSVNNYLALELSNGNEVILPQKMGTIELRKQKPIVEYRNGKLVVGLSIDWDSTLKLWYEDSEAYERKQVIKTPEKYIFKFIYNKYNATYENKSFFEFDINRQIKLNLKAQIKAGNIDAFLKYG